MTTHQWHRVIDAVAHDMTAGVPDAGFRARVLERVAAESATRPTAFAWVWRGAAVAVALGVVVIAGGILRPSRVAPPAGEIARDTGPRLPTEPATSPASGQTEATSALVSSRAARPPQSPLALLEWRARNIAALESLPPLAVDHIQPESLAISQLTVAPLGIAPLVIPAIDDDR